MKRKLFTALVILGAISLTACEDQAMDEILQDTTLNSMENGGDGDDDDDTGDGSNNPTGGGGG